MNMPINTMTDVSPALNAYYLLDSTICSPIKYDCEDLASLFWRLLRSSPDARELVLEEIYI